MENTMSGSPQFRETGKNAISFDLFGGVWKYVILTAPTAAILVGAVWGLLVSQGYLIWDASEAQNNTGMSAFGFFLLVAMLAFVAGLLLRLAWVVFVSIPILLWQRKLAESDVLGSRRTGLVFVASGVAAMMGGR